MIHVQICAKTWSSLVKCVPLRSVWLREFQKWPYTAVENIKRLNDGLDESSRKVLRISVSSGGCSGFRYEFDVNSIADIEEDDLVCVKNGAEVVVDPVSLTYLKGSCIDYTQEMIRSSFTIQENPNSEASCGCGISFTAKQ